MLHKTTHVIIGTVDLVNTEYCHLILAVCLDSKNRILKLDCFYNIVHTLLTPSGVNKSCFKIYCKVISTVNLFTATHYFIAKD